MSKKKVLILFCPLTLDKTEKPEPDFIIGIGYLLAVLREAGHQVKFIDAYAEGVQHQEMMPDNRVRYGLPFNEINQIIDEFRPDLIGISCPYTINAQDAYDLSRAIKTHNEGLKIVFGGSHSTVNWQFILENKYADFVVLGEGEKTIVELVDNLESPEKYPQIKGLAYRVKEEISINEKRPFIEDLDKLPFPARDLMPFHLYKEAKNKVDHYNRFYPFQLITSRGCPGQCVFCSVKAIWGNTWRGRDPKKVADEIEELVTRYNAKEIHFMDDSISANRERMAQVCREIIQRKFKIYWTTPNGIAIWTLSPETVKLMKQAGCYRLTFGLESGSKEVLNNFVNKHYDYAQATNLIKYANKLGIWTIGTFVLGFPYEKMNNMQDTINFGISSNIDFAVFYIATPLPGTKMYDIYLKEKLISPNTPFTALGINPNTVYFTAARIRKIRDNAYKKFLLYRLLRTWKIVYKIRSLDDLRYLGQVTSNFTKVTFDQFFRLMRVRDFR